MRIAIVIAVLFAYGALGGILVNPGFESDGSSTTTAGWNTYGANV